MKKLILLLLLLISNVLFAQKAIVHIGTEGYYSNNIVIGAGLSYKEFKVLWFQQQATHDNELYIRHGIFLEQGFAHIEKFYWRAGIRVFTSNDKYLGVTPHFTMAYKWNNSFEIPLIYSTFRSYNIFSLGLRFYISKQ